MSSSGTADVIRARRIIERLFLPWYSREVEAVRDAYTESIRQRSIVRRVAADQVRLEYLAAAERFRRR